MGHLLNYHPSRYRHFCSPNTKDIGTFTKSARLIFFLATLCSSAAYGERLTGEEVEALYSRIAADENLTMQEYKALNDSKVTIRVRQRTPLYEKPLISSRVVDYIGQHTNYKWRCYPAAMNSNWMRCASDEFLYIGRVR